MAKSKNSTIFFCQNCGYESAKWMGQCPGCREWNTFVEESVVTGSGKKSAKSGGLVSNSGQSKPAMLSEISLQEEDRISTAITELDRVLGGGIVAGSLTLVGGDPGIGKSTLLLQVCRNLALAGREVLYVSGTRPRPSSVSVMMLTFLSSSRKSRMLTLSRSLATT